MSNLDTYRKKRSEPNWLFVSKIFFGILMMAGLLAFMTVQVEDVLRGDKLVISSYVHADNTNKSSLEANPASYGGSVPFPPRVGFTFVDTDDIYHQIPISCYYYFTPKTNRSETSPDICGKNAFSYNGTTTYWTPNGQRFSQTIQNQFFLWAFRLFAPLNASNPEYPLSGWFEIVLDLGDGNFYNGKIEPSYIVMDLKPIAFYPVDLPRNTPIDNANWHYTVTQDMQLGASAYFATVDLRATTNVVQKQVEEFVHKWYSAIGQIGGAFGLVASLSIFLFGSPRISPWGIIQKWFFRCGGFDKALAKEYVTPYGRPLVDPIPAGFINQTSSDKESSIGKLVDTVRHRQELLEAILAEYYVDNDFIKKLVSNRLDIEKNPPL